MTTSARSAPVNANRPKSMMNRVFRLHSYLAITARVLSPAFSLIEPHYFRRWNVDDDSKNRPIFIVGAPRSGSTILYQYLTQSMDCLYIDNLACPFYRNMPIGIWLSRRIFGSRNHDSFESRYGNTSTLHSPSECQSFWYRWFPKDRDFVDHGDLSEQTLLDLRSAIHSMMNEYKRNFVFKNLSCGQRIRALHEAFPRAIFISIKRDPVYTAQSLLLARRKLGISDDVWWSVKPRNYLNLMDLPIKERLVSQIFYTEKQISEDLGKLPAENVFEINYVEYGTKLQSLLMFLKSDLKENIDTSGFKFRNRKILDGGEFEELEKIARTFEWQCAGYE